MPSESRELIFPLKGISEGWSFGRQPEATCPDAQNVIPIDALGDRIRGGQRWGLSKYYTAQHNGSEALQRITSIVAPQIGAISNDYTESFPQSDGPFWSANTGTWVHYKASNTSGLTNSCKLLNTIIDTDADCPAIEGNNLKIEYVGTDYTSSHVYTGRDLDFAGAYSVSFDAIWNGAVHTRGRRAVYLRVNPSLNSQMYAVRFITEFWPGTRGQVAMGLLNCSTGGWTSLEALGTGTDIKISNAMAAGMTITVDVAADGEVKITLGNLAADGFGPYTFTTKMTSYSTYHGVGMGQEVDATYNDDIDIDDFTITGSTDTAAPQSERVYKSVVVSGGDIYAAKFPDIPYLTINGENAVATSGRVDAQPAYQKVYFCDGTASGYKVLDNATDTVSAWTPSAGSLPVGTVDATKACRIVTLYRGRIVMAGLSEYPHNWYMSKVNDPLDWDYGATTSAIMAVAGNNTDAGECPDIITCLAPYSDDLMYIGGDHTLWVMTGDPADRGRIDNISEQIGVAGPDAWAFDANGIFYFFGMGTIWKMVPGGVPEPISRNRLDATFNAIDLTTNTVHLHWDNVRHGLFIFVVPASEGAATHYYWDQQSDSFWKIVFPNTMGPSTAYPYDGDNPNDNALLLGGWDGYIRQIDASAVNDDGTAISSYIKYPPIAVGGPERNTRIGRILSILDSNSDNVTLTAYAEDTVQRAIQSATIRYIHTLGAGRTTVLKRVAGNAIMLMLSNSTLSKTWAIENLVVNIEAIGRTRKNQL